MRELSLFTGAGGGLLGTHLLGWRPIGYVEFNDHCQRVIKARIQDGILPEAPIYGDIRTFISEGYAASYKGMVDIITGGFPCQDISIGWTGEGSSKGLQGNRSGLWTQFAECIRLVRPRYAYIENTPMLTIRGLDRIMCDLASLGYDAKWGVMGAAAVGACHVRERIWILAHPLSQGLERKQQLQKNNRTDRIRRAWVYVPDRQLPYGLQWWEPTDGPLEPQFIGANDVVANRVDRIKAIGNGQVPTVVKAAWELLTEGK